VIRCRGLTVAFDGVTAVDHVDLEVAAGESFGLVGESGSGKSTILRALSGLNADWSGAMSIDGKPIAPRRGRDFYKLCQMVFQDPYGSLHPRQTIDQLLTEPLAIHRVSDREARIDRVLGEVGLGPSFRFRFPHQLSGGQRQRVAIARALILEPRLMLLDEPTSALDVSVQAEILNLLKRLRRERGLTFLLVTHNIAVVSVMCDRLAVMKQGRIVETLSTDDLRAGRVREAYTAQLLHASEGYDRAAAGALVEA
jgi:peptide/nickel transport system ATP-binding protein